MKRQGIVFMLLLLQVLFICCGCGSQSTDQLTAAPQETAAVVTETAVEEAAPEEAALEEVELEEAASKEFKIDVEEAIGIFEGLEDNQTAIFSFDGAETAFHFGDPQVKSVLFEAVSGSSYTLSYHYDDSLGYVIYQISE